MGGNRGVLPLKKEKEESHIILEYKYIASGHLKCDSFSYPLPLSAFLFASPSQIIQFVCKRIVIEPRRSSQIMHTNTVEEDGYSNLNHLPQHPARHYMSLNINQGRTDTSYLNFLCYGRQ